MANDAQSPIRDGGHISFSKGPRPEHDAGAVVSVIIKIVWVATVLIWPILKWVMVSDCVIQLIKMMYHWNTPGRHAGLVFLLHFLVFTASAYFVGAYKPKGL